MGIRARQIVARTVLGLLIVGVLYFVASPYVVVRQIETAAERGDTATLARLVDFPAVRESLRASAIYAASAQEHDAFARVPGRDSEIAALLRTKIIVAAIGPLIEGTVTPQAIATLVRDPQRLAAIASSPSSNAARPAPPAPRVHLHYISLDWFAIDIGSAARPLFLRPNILGVEGPLSARLCRTNLFSWQVCAARFPTN